MCNIVAKPLVHVSNWPSDITTACHLATCGPRDINIPVIRVNSFIVYPLLDLWPLNKQPIDDTSYPSTLISWLAICTCLKNTRLIFIQIASDTIMRSHKLTLRRGSRRTHVYSYTFTNCPNFSFRVFSHNAVFASDAYFLK